MWKAIIKKFSEIDSNGNMEVLFDIEVDGKAKYKTFTTIGTPDECLINIRKIGVDLKEKVEQVETQKIIFKGLEIDL